MTSHNATDEQVGWCANCSEYTYGDIVNADYQFVSAHPFRHVKAKVELFEKQIQERKPVLDWWED